MQHFSSLLFQFNLEYFIDVNFSELINENVLIVKFFRDDNMEKLCTLNFLELLIRILLDDQIISNC